MPLVGRETVDTISTKGGGWEVWSRYPYHLRTSYIEDPFQRPLTAAAVSSVTASTTALLLAFSMRTRSLARRLSAKRQKLSGPFVRSLARSLCGKTAGSSVPPSLRILLTR